MKHTYSARSRLMAAVLIFALVLTMSPAVHAADKVYYPIDFTEAVLNSRIAQRVSGGCAVASMATVEAYLYGAVTDEEKEIVYDALIAANGDDDYAYWGNVGYKTSQDSIDWEAVYNQIAQGYPCIIHRPAAGDLGQHWSVIAGYQGSSTTLEPDQFLVVEVNEKAGAAIQTVAQWRGAATVDRYTWRGSGMTISGLSGTRFAINHPPVVKPSGVAHVVGGTIVSDANITRIQVQVTSLTAGKVIYSKTLTPNAQSYDMSALDAGMSYSSWSAGSYYLTIHVTTGDGKESMYGKYFEIAAAYPAEMPNPSYAFFFDPGTGSGTMESFSLHLGDSFTLPRAALTHTSGTFLGWHVVRGDGKWLTNDMQWLTGSEISGGSSKMLLADGSSGIMDAWWIRDAQTMCGYTFVALWSSDSDDPTVDPEEPSSPSEPEVSELPDTMRLSGSTRYETSFSIADTLLQAWQLDAFDNIIIASGVDFADALSGSYLATVKKAPILITNGNNGDALCSYIQKNWSGKGKVYILGGTAAVPEKIFTALANAGIPSTRLSGNTRFDTNLAILEEAGVGKGEILITSGYDYADALSASATGLPILLVNNTTGKLTDSQISFLNAHSDNIYIIIGGEAAVSLDMEIALQSLAALGNEIGRVYGAGREETSIEVAETFFDGADRVMLTYSRNFPDGLCGGPLAYALNAPLLLVNAGREQPAAGYVASQSIRKYCILGGTSAVSEASVQMIFPE